jgi:hypothetical protein
VVEHSLGKGEVDSSILSGSTSFDGWLAEEVGEECVRQPPSDAPHQKYVVPGNR